MLKALSDAESRIITIIRTIAMLLIMLCHYCDFFDGMEFLSQLFNVGVPVFFIISGFLYGQKTFNNTWKWYKKQFVKIVVPLYTYYILSGLILLIIGKLGKLKAFDIIKLLLNLQGLFGGKIGNIQSGHLWFVTFILICYLITPLLQIIRNKINLGKAILLVAITSTLWIFIILSIDDCYFVTWVPGIFCYILAYYLSAFWKREKSKMIIWCSIAFSTFALLALRFVVNRVLGAETNVWLLLYSRVIVPYSQCFLAFLLVFSIFYICLKYTRLRDFCSKIFKPFDKYSYYVYIVHNIFVEGVFSLTLFFDNKLFLTLLFIVLTSISSIILKLISSAELSLINKKHYSST